jgi:hypothetical protein
VVPKAELLLCAKYCKLVRCDWCSSGVRACVGVVMVSDGCLLIGPGLRSEFSAPNSRVQHPTNAFPRVVCLWRCGSRGSRSVELGSNYNLAGRTSSAQFNFRF